MIKYVGVDSVMKNVLSSIYTKKQKHDFISVVTATMQLGVLTSLFFMLNKLSPLWEVPVI